MHGRALLGLRDDIVCTRGYSKQCANVAKSMIYARYSENQRYFLFQECDVEHLYGAVAVLAAPFQCEWLLTLMSKRMTKVMVMQLLFCSVSTKRPANGLSRYLRLR